VKLVNEIAWVHLNLSRRKIGVAFLGLIILLGLCRVFFPCTLKGKWIGPVMTGHMCDSHCFIYFIDGCATNYHDGASPKEMGSYKKVGWNVYAWNIPGNQKPITIHVGWFFLRGQTDEVGIPPRFWGWRDPRFRDCDRIIIETRLLHSKAERTRVASQPKETK
jgi:hypothetical protein